MFKCVFHSMKSATYANDLRKNNVNQNLTWPSLVNRTDPISQHRGPRWVSADTISMSLMYATCSCTVAQSSRWGKVGAVAFVSSSYWILAIWNILLSGNMLQSSPKCFQNKDYGTVTCGHYGRHLKQMELFMSSFLFYEQKTKIVFESS